MVVAGHSLPTISCLRVEGASLDMLTTLSHIVMFDSQYESNRILFFVIVCNFFHWDLFEDVSTHASTGVLSQLQRNAQSAVLPMSN